jgi:MFS family permease
MVRVRSGQGNRVVRWVNRRLAFTLSDRSNEPMPGPLTIRPRTAVTIAYVTSLLMASLDTNIVNVMLPTLSREFSAPLTSVKWTVIGYVLALAITMPVAAWLTERFGIRRVYLFALGLFVLASACCANRVTTSSGRFWAAPQQALASTNSPRANR